MYVYNHTYDIIITIDVYFCTALICKILQICLIERSELPREPNQGSQQPQKIAKVFLNVPVR